MTIAILLKFMVYILVAVGGFLIVHKLVPATRREEYNNIAGFVFATVSVVYTVLLAFIVVTVWSQYTTAENLIDAEASHITDLHHNANAFPDSIKVKIQAASKKYVNDLLQYEWPAMEQIKTSPETEASFNALWQAHYEYKPVQDVEHIWLSASVNELNQLGEARTARLSAVNYNLHPFMWIVLYLGAILTIGITYLFGSVSQTVHIILIICLTISIGMIMILIESLVLPFSGAIKLGPGVLEAVLQRLG